MVAVNYLFKSTQMIDRITLVGCGGTGSAWSSAIARILYDRMDRGLHIPKLSFVDPDKVEAKNVGRQMFSVAEIGRYKAEVLARRFSLSLGIRIDWYPESFSANKHSGSGTLLCGAVDNYLARKAMSKANCLWIDAGNHRTAGQVIVGNTDDWHDVKPRPIDQEVVYRELPYATTLFPGLLEPEPEAENPRPDLSCAELVSLGEQHLLINTLMASVAAQYTYLLLNHEPVKSFITYVDADSLSMRSIPITPDDLNAYRPVPIGVAVV